MKLVTSIFILIPLMVVSGCKTNSSAESSDVLAASKPEDAFKAISEQEFCSPNEEEGVPSCEKVFLDFMNSPESKGKELIITCGVESVGFKYDGTKGGGATLDPKYLEELKRLVRRNNPNLVKSCAAGFRDV